MSSKINTNIPIPPEFTKETADDAFASPEESVGLGDKQIQDIKEDLAVIQAYVLKIQKLLSGDKNAEDSISPTVVKIQKKMNKETDSKEQYDEKMIEGVFDGQNMVGSDGHKYHVPANYASKSKLVEGDILKLTIGDHGNFIYKQIAPTDRDRLVGKLSQDDETGDYYIKAQGRRYKVLTASITYYKGEAGDEAVILVPKNAETNWAAVENIIKESDISTKAKEGEEMSLSI